MAVLITGSAGFIGYHVAQTLLKRGEEVIGVDNLNNYYDRALKFARLSLLLVENRFHFYQVDIAERKLMYTLLARHPSIDRVIHLAAQAGVRYSLTHPFLYSHTNIKGNLVILEFCRLLHSCRHLVYASSSAVYGANFKLPFSVQDRVDTPVSFYAVTKRSCELMSYCYSYLYHIPATGLRFFTVYGPWGRPDMALYLFTTRILTDVPILVFNDGDMKRDFTYIDDVVSGIINCLDYPPTDNAGPPHRLYNIGNSKPESLLKCITLLEKALDHSAIIKYESIQLGDIQETYADTTTTIRDIGYTPRTSLEVGIEKFIAWYHSYHKTKTS